MNSKIILLTILSSLFYLISNGQSESKYQISTSINWEDFEKLTKFEIEHNKIYERKHRRLDSLYRIGKKYPPKLTAKEKKKLYKKELKNRISYKDNRARYYVETTEEDTIVVDKSYFSKGAISTECSCALKDKEIDIRMGIWVFGGFFYKIKIEGKEFEAEYLEDANSRKPFKYQLTDSIALKKITLKLDDASLTFNKKIKPKLGKQVTGHLKFTTPEYLVHTTYRLYSAESKYHIALVKGELFFTCTLKKPIEYPHRKNESKPNE